MAFAGVHYTLKVIHVGHGLGKLIIGGYICGELEFPSIRKGMDAMESRGLVFRESRGLLASRAGISERTVARAVFA